MVIKTSSVTNSTSVIHTAFASLRSCNDCGGLKIQFIIWIQAGQIATRITAHSLVFMKLHRFEVNSHAPVLTSLHAVASKSLVL
jgi:hypothetical protein